MYTAGLSQEIGALGKDSEEGDVIYNNVLTFD